MPDTGHAAVAQAHLRLLMDQLHAHVATDGAGGGAGYPASSSSAAAACPTAWPSTLEAIRTMRRTLTQIYAPVLTEEERTRAKEWGFRPETQRSVTDAAAASGSALTTTQGTADAAAAQSSPPAPVPGSYPRFDVSLPALSASFRSGAASVSRIVTYHHALISSVQTASGVVKAGGPGASTLSQLHHVARQYLQLIKYRGDLQNHQTRLTRAVALVHERAQAEMHDREQRRAHLAGAPAPAPAPVAPLSVGSLPLCDLHALASSLGVVRSSLQLTNGAEDPTALHVTLPPETYTLSASRTIDGRELAGCSLTAAPLAPSLAWVRHTVNLSSTGASTCFVLEIRLVQPLVQTDEERAIVAELIMTSQRAAGGITALPPLSSLSQLLRHGFCVSGTLLTMSGEGDLAEQPLDSSFVRALYRTDLAAVQAKIALLLANEHNSEAHMDLKIHLKRHAVVQSMQAEADRLEAANFIAATGSTSDARFFRHDRALMEARVEGPSLTITEANMPPTIVAPGSRNAAASSPKSLWRTDDLAITFVGMEKSERALDDAMDTGLMDEAFSYRFLLSTSLTMSFEQAQRGFAADLYRMSGQPSPLPSADGPAVRDGSYHSVCLAQAASTLCDEDGLNGVKAHTQRVLGSQLHAYTASSGGAANSTLMSPSFLMSSFLVRDLAALPNLIDLFRRAHVFQHLYRSCFEETDATPAAATKRDAVRAPVPATAPSSTAAAPATSAKLKFSFRELLEEQPSATSPSSFATPSSNGLASQAPRDSALHVSVFGDALKGQLIIRTTHPLTRVDLVIDVQIMCAHEQTTRVTITCASGRTPSSDYATRVLNATASIPLLMRCVIEQCSRATK